MRQVLLLATATLVVSCNSGSKTPKPAVHEPLTSENAALVLIYHQVGLMTGVRDYSTGELKHNVVALAKAAKALKVGRRYKLFAVAEELDPTPGPRLVRTGGDDYEHFAYYRTAALTPVGRSCVGAVYAPYPCVVRLANLQWYSRRLSPRVALLQLLNDL